MRTFTQQQLAEILEKHRKWLASEEGGERADLSGSDLRGSNLRYSNLRGSNLRGSDLRYSNLRYSDLRGSDLRGSDLSYSDLRGSDLRGSNGLITILTGTTWPIGIGLTHTTIGCQRHTNEEWQAFTDDQIAMMHNNALAFWQQWKPTWEIAVKNCTAQFGPLHKDHEEKVNQ